MNDTDMTPEEVAAEDRRFRLRNRAIICRRCGALPTTIMDGKDFADGFPGLKYKCCGSCGHKEAKTSSSRRKKL